VSLPGNKTSTTGAFSLAGHIWPACGLFGKHEKGKRWGHKLGEQEIVKFSGRTS